MGCANSSDARTANERSTGAYTAGGDSDAADVMSTESVELHDELDYFRRKRRQSTGYLVDDEANGHRAANELAVLKRAVAHDLNDDPDQFATVIRQSSRQQMKAANATMSPKIEAWVSTVVIPAPGSSPADPAFASPSTASVRSEKLGRASSSSSLFLDGDRAGSFRHTRSSSLFSPRLPHPAATPRDSLPHQVLASEETSVVSV